MFLPSHNKISLLQAKLPKDTDQLTLKILHSLIEHYFSKQTACHTANINTPNFFLKRLNLKLTPHTQSQNAILRLRNQSLSFKRYWGHLT